MVHKNTVNPTNLPELLEAAGISLERKYPVPFSEKRLAEFSLTKKRLMRIIRNNGKSLTEGEITNICGFFGISRELLLDPLPEGFKARIRMEVYGEEIY